MCDVFKATQVHLGRFLWHLHVQACTRTQPNIAIILLLLLLFLLLLLLVSTATRQEKAQPLAALCSRFSQFAQQLGVMQDWAGLQRGYTWGVKGT